MIQGEELKKPSVLNLFLWSLLCFQAGAINSAGFISCQRFVSHVTGFATLFGVELASANYRQALGMLSVPVFFIFGAMLSAFFCDRRVLKGQLPLYSYSLMILICLNLILLVAGDGQLLGEFHAQRPQPQHYFLLVLLCFYAGFQNAMVTTASGSNIRTTHLTGLTTDIGIGLTRLISKFEKKELKQLMIRTTLVVGFILGATMGSFVFFNYEYKGFILTLCLSTLTWLIYLKAYRKVLSQI